MAADTQCYQFPLPILSPQSSSLIGPAWVRCSILIQSSVCVCVRVFRGQWTPGQLNHNIWGWDPDITICYRCPSSGTKALGSVIFMKIKTVVGLIMPSPTPGHVHGLIPRTCASITLHSKEELKMGLEVLIN